MTTKSLNVYQRIAAVMDEVKYVQKTGYNSFHKYNYAKEADYIAAMRPALLKHGLVILPLTTKTTQQGELTTIEVNFNIINVDDPKDSVIVPSVGTGMDKGDKGAYKALTGAKKYLFSLGFLIETGDDAEADENDYDQQGQKKTGSSYYGKGKSSVEASPKSAVSTTSANTAKPSAAKNTAASVKTKEKAVEVSGSVVLDTKSGSISATTSDSPTNVTTTPAKGISSFNRNKLNGNGVAASPVKSASKGGW